MGAWGLAGELGGRLARGATAALAAVAIACASDVEPIVECRAAGGLSPVCGFQNPEDLAVLPDGTTLLVSQFGSMEGGKSGSLAVFDSESREHEVVFRGGAGGRARPGWGAADCPGPPSAAFSPHGIDLARRPDGTLGLWVVNHGGRESVELFEVSVEREEVRVEWRGCALPPEDAFLNDVVALPEGGFAVTHMFPREGGMWQLVKGLLGWSTGYVLAWDPERGFEKVPGSDGAMPNGIEASADGRELYVNVYLGGEVRRISRETGETLARADVTRPDNVTWSRDGRLLVASHVASLSEVAACGEIERGACPFEFAILSLDPETLAQRELLRHGGPPMGGGTVAVDTGDSLWIGSFAGDRLLHFVLNLGDGVAT